MFTDFIGKEIQIGSFVAYPGGGNTGAEYGQILYRVVDVNEAKEKIKAERIIIYYSHTTPEAMPKDFLNGKAMTLPHTKTDGDTMYVKYIAIRTKASWISKLNRLVVVEPKEKIIEIFNKISNLDESFTDLIEPIEVSKWLHGSWSF